MVSNIAAKQDALYQKRIVYANPINSATVIITSLGSRVIQMALNRVPYQGYESSDFSGAAGYHDFIYQFSGGDVTITLHPDLDIQFEAGDYIDLIVS